METFLQLVAKDLYAHVGSDLSRTAVIFPNKRASLFFNECLATEAAGSPLWSPAYISISELFQRLSPYTLGDPIRLVCLLYKVYADETGSAESLDEFFYWGELLISDFDDVDKNLADATRLFGNLQELKDIGDFSFLSPEQETAIREFFSNFSIEKSTALKEKFLTIWNHLGNIYRRFREEQQLAGIAYEGMVYRDAMERMELETLPYDCYVFVGFNVLNRVEQLLFRRLQEANRALFYWDYDVYYTTLPRTSVPPFTHEAGEFILRNMKEFPNALPDSCFDVMRRSKTVRFVASPTENAQARYILQWYGSVSHGREKENAVVLCNESLLLPVLHSLPSDVHNVNITMGFPLAQTPVSGLVSALVDLQVDGYDKTRGCYSYEQVGAVLRHPYIMRLSGEAKNLDRELTDANRFHVLPSELSRDVLLEKLFTPVNGNANLCRWLADVINEVAAIYRTSDENEDRHDMYAQLYRESLFKSYTIVNRLLSLTESGELNVSGATLGKLIARLMGSASIPFHGEPAVGLQVMGVLETRNLDFRNLLMLSVNEGKLPKNEGDTSFIPYNLRRAFGLTTIDHKISVYAYYFYRLVQRAEDITLVYNTSDDGMNRGEMSRFMLQYLVESGQTVRRISLTAGQNPAAERSIVVSKTPGMLRRLAARFDGNGQGHYLSPSAINKYLDCRLRFFFRYVAGIKKPDEVTADIDSATFGNVFHKVAENVYTDLGIRNQEVSPEQIETLLNDKRALERYVDNAFREEFFHVQPSAPIEYNGTQHINRMVIMEHLKNMLKTDKEYAPFSIELLETEKFEDFELDTSIGEVRLRIGGKIDRMDRKDSMLRIVDYKTGGDDPRISSMDVVFAHKKPSDGRVSQVFLYSSILCRQYPDVGVKPVLFLVNKRATADRHLEVKLGGTYVEDFCTYEEDFRKRLLALLTEIFDLNVPFTQTDKKKDMCQYCDYASLCRIRQQG